MTPVTNPINARSVRTLKRHPVKLTALLYLQDALVSEAYEDCPEFIQIALEFGAKPFEIEDLIEDPRRSPRP